MQISGILNLACILVVAAIITSPNSVSAERVSLDRRLSTAVAKSSDVSGDWVTETKVEGGKTIVIRRRVRRIRKDKGKLENEASDQSSQDSDGWVTKKVIRNGKTVIISQRRKIVRDKGKLENEASDKNNSVQENLDTLPST